MLAAIRPTRGRVYSCPRGEYCGGGYRSPLPVRIQAARNKTADLPEGHIQHLSGSSNRLPCRTQPSQVAVQEREPPDHLPPYLPGNDASLLQPFQLRLLIRRVHHRLSLQPEAHIPVSCGSARRKIASAGCEAERIRYCRTRGPSPYRPSLSTSAFFRCIQLAQNSMHASNPFVVCED